MQRFGEGAGLWTAPEMMRPEPLLRIGAAGLRCAVKSFVAFLTAAAHKTESERREIRFHPERGNHKRLFHE